MQKSGLAFSLVEVVMALGICSFAILSIIGTMPVGLSTMREAMDQTTEAQIVRRVSSEVSLHPFNRLDELIAEGDLLFTQDGTLQEINAPDSNTRYLVRLAKTTVDYPGALKVASALPTNLAALSIEIRKVAGAVEVSRSTNVILVPNSGN